VCQKYLKRNGDTLYNQTSLGAASAKCQYARKAGQIYVLGISLPVLKSTKRVTVR
jgi:hypothetical protein